MADSYFPDNLRAAMEARGYNGAKLASMIGSSPSAISRYLKGTQSPNAWMLARMASALEVSTDFLIFGASDDLAWIPATDDNLPKSGNMCVVMAENADKVRYMGLAHWSVIKHNWMTMSEPYPTDPTLKVKYFIQLPQLPDPD